METTAEIIIGVTKFTAKYKGDKVVIFHNRGSVIWENGKWADDNRGKHYLHYNARERLERAFNLK